MRSFHWLVLVTAILLAPALVQAQWGVAPDGTKGRLHVVEKGDTLWDITETYLGTPWIWPSVWKENEGEIENPHLIEPGEVIWITERGMRKLTAEEAARIEPLPGDGEGDSERPLELEDSASGDEDRLPNEDRSGDSFDPFASLDGTGADIERIIRYPGLHRFGFVSAKEMIGAGAILGSHEEAYWTSQERRTIVSLGEGQVHVGDRYTIFRTRRKVHHPLTGEDLGWFVQRLGTAEITEIHPESSFARIMSAYGEIEPGDRMIPYEAEALRFPVLPTELAFSGVILAKQPYRLYAGEGDLVVIDRGHFDGVAVGNELEIYRSGREVMDPVSSNGVLVPDDILGRMFVLKVGPRTSVALIRTARQEIQIGDHYRSL